MMRTEGGIFFLVLALCSELHLTSSHHEPLPVVKPCSCPAQRKPCDYIHPPPKICHAGHSDCPKNTHCCPYCDHMACLPPPEEKCGSCPKWKLPCLYPAPKTFCHCDAECPGEMKCCDRCGWQCIRPMELHSGMCPPVHKSCVAPEYKCECDKDCRRKKKKCCLDKHCVWRCMWAYQG
ncbi:whey acidic protein-like [Rhinatrema bivittatum]|uniref:whey acidic protein-like n=1 Tax=Rhinatrema bivittatum TaxID=194408 RepID=UPI001128A702|nr:whey acidic protein-like [Rhinatrema bivittatum]